MRQAQSPWFCELSENPTRAPTGGSQELGVVYVCTPGVPGDGGTGSPLPIHTYRHCSFITTLKHHTYTSFHIWGIRIHSSLSSQGLDPLHRETNWDKWQATAQISSSEVTEATQRAWSTALNPPPPPEDGSQTIIMREKGERRGELHHWDRGQAWRGTGQKVSQLPAV